MKCTSAEAAKLLRKLNEELMEIKDRESKSSVFIAAVDEKLDDVRPEYNYRETQDRLATLEAQVRKLKHAINAFNLTTEVPGFGMTVDQLLVYIPQLSERKRRLATMAARLPKERVNAPGVANKSFVEYRYANYDIKQAAADLVAVKDELARAQTALDVVNTSVEFELEL